MKKPPLLLATHVAVAAGIYLLPILTEPPAPADAAVQAVAARALYTGEFRRA
jgi:hypothetical protein